MAAPAPEKKAACYVLGVGMTKFAKPRGKADYTELVYEAGIKALLDAGQSRTTTWTRRWRATAYGDSTCGQRVLYQFGMTQIPVYNVNNNCATGSTGLHLARQLVSAGRGGTACWWLGFEEDERGQPAGGVGGPRGPAGHDGRADGGDARAARRLAGGGADLRQRRRRVHGAPRRHGRRLRRDRARQPRALGGQPVQASSARPTRWTRSARRRPCSRPLPLTKLQCCPTSDGGAAAVVGVAGLPGRAAGAGGARGAGGRHGHCHGTRRLCSRSAPSTWPATT